MLVTVADLSADWQLELDVADDRIGHVLAAQASEETEALPVRFRLRSADAAYTGHIEKIGMTASVDTKDAAAAHPTVDVVVAFDKHELTRSRAARPAARRFRPRRNRLRPPLARLRLAARRLGRRITWLRF